MQPNGTHVNSDSRKPSKTSTLVDQSIGIKVLLWKRDSVEVTMSRRPMKSLVVVHPSCAHFGMCRLLGATTLDICCPAAKHTAVWRCFAYCSLEMLRLHTAVWRCYVCTLQSGDVTFAHCSLEMLRLHTAVWRCYVCTLQSGDVTLAHCSLEMLRLHTAVLKCYVCTLQS